MRWKEKSLEQTAAAPFAQTRVAWSSIVRQDKKGGGNDKGLKHQSLPLISARCVPCLDLPLYGRFG